MLIEYAKRPACMVTVDSLIMYRSQVYTVRQHILTGYESYDMTEPFCICHTSTGRVKLIPLTETVSLMYRP